jgi:alanyl-tRNA synthetase
MLLNDIRASFLEYYRQQGHTLIPSASLVPVADTSLLLINAGMAPLKRYFMGQDAPPAPRAMSCQKCVRTVDIDQVGYTNRHNTFFEMLGKFSFGDYFKLEAMRMSIEWMTGKDWLGLDPARLYITHHERDEETRNLWLKEMGWPEARLIALGDKDNLWAAGETGPWGYDTEYFWDFTPGDKPVSRTEFIELSESGRIVEVGNDVFMQFIRAEDGSVSDLPKKNVDYGGGLERYAMVMQDVNTVYKTDAMDYLIHGFAEVVAAATGSAPSDDELFELQPGGFNPFWLAADHIRTATFLLGDGVTPGNIGRNYVLRRLIRRIIAQAYRVGVRKPFIMDLAGLVIDKLGGHYVDLKQKREQLIEPWINKEEQQFFKVMEQGYGRLRDRIEQAREAGQPVAGEFVFELYDTYGFPSELALNICREHCVEADRDAFERDMAAQKTRARGAAKFAGDMGEQEERMGDVEFLGYEMTACDVTVTGVEPLDDIRGLAPLIAGPKPKKDKGDPVPGIKLSTDATPFYADSGGQPSDTGWLPLDGENYAMQSTATRGVHIVLGQPGVEVGSCIVIAVDLERRNSLRRPHTTNHLMLGAMREVLGEHVSQAGSQLGEDEIRFDFSHFQAVTPEEMRRIEAIVNRHIIADWPVRSDSMPLVAAKEMGVTAVFDEKYGAEVRVLSIGDGEPGNLEGWVSRELCGGTHLSRTSQAGMFLIMREESVQSGVRRFYAVVGHKAFAYVQAAREGIDWLGVHYKRPLPNPTGLDLAHIDEYAPLVAGWQEEITGKIEEGEQKLREAHQAAAEARRELVVADKLEALQAQVVELGGLQILSAAVELDDRGDLKYLVERFAGGLWKENYAVFIAANVGGKAALSCKASPEAVARGVKASDMIKLGAGICGGGGGGKPEFAEAGGKDGGKAPEAAHAVLSKVRELLA